MQTCIKIRNYTEIEFLKVGEEYRQATYVFQENWELIHKRIPDTNSAAGWERVKKITNAENGIHTFPENPWLNSGGGSAAAK